MAASGVDGMISAHAVEMLVCGSSHDRRTKIKTRFKNGKKIRVIHKLDEEQMPCVVVIAATVAPSPLDPRADLTLSHAPAPGTEPSAQRTRMMNRIAQGMRMAKYRLADEWESSAGRVQSTAKEVKKKKRKCTTLE